MNKTASLKGHAFKVSTLILALLVGGALLLTGCPPGIEPGADGDTYIVTINTGANGALTVVANLTPINSGDEAAAGSIISLSAVPSNGYELDTLSYNDGADHPLTTEFTGVNYLAAFTMPANAVTITATFKQPDANSHSITITAPANGTITASAGSAASGATITLTITPASGYEPDA
ncbi:MAG: hypothetical protein LBN21_08245, partial [Treponema sp.]|nr:hypothetical protein [Treponema sp.]